MEKKKKLTTNLFCFFIVSESPSRLNKDKVKIISDSLYKSGQLTKKYEVTLAVLTLSLTYSNKNYSDFASY